MKWWVVIVLLLVSVQVWAVTPVTFSCASSYDTVNCDGVQATYPPDFTFCEAAQIDTNKSVFSGSYHVNASLMRWDTSSLPDDATITDAWLEFDIGDGQATSDDARLFQCEWYAHSDWTQDEIDNDGIANYTTGSSGTALSINVTDIDDTGGTPYSFNSLALTGADANVSRTASTALRCTISGGQPGGPPAFNEVTLGGFGIGGGTGCDDLGPKLHLEYDTGPTPTAPAPTHTATNTLPPTPTITPTPNCGTGVSAAAPAGFTGAGGFVAVDIPERHVGQSVVVSITSWPRNAANLYPTPGINAIYNEWSFGTTADSISGLYATARIGNTLWFGQFLHSFQTVFLSSPALETIAPESLTFTAWQASCASPCTPNNWLRDTTLTEVHATVTLVDHPVGCGFVVPNVEALWDTGQSPDQIFNHYTNIDCNISPIVDLTDTTTHIQAVLAAGNWQLCTDPETVSCCGGLPITHLALGTVAGCNYYTLGRLNENASSPAPLPYDPTVSGTHWAESAASSRHTMVELLGERWTDFTNYAWLADSQVVAPASLQTLQNPADVCVPTGDWESHVSAFTSADGVVWTYANDGDQKWQRVTDNNPLNRTGWQQESAGKFRTSVRAPGAPVAYNSSAYAVSTNSEPDLGDPQLGESRYNILDLEPETPVPTIVDTQTPSPTLPPSTPTITPGGPTLTPTETPTAINTWTPTLTPTPFIVLHCHTFTPVVPATRTPILSPTPGGQPTVTPTCPVLARISGPVYKTNGNLDRNDTIWFYTDIQRPLVIAGCVYNPEPPLSTTTDHDGNLVPIYLAQGLPVSITAVHGGGAAAQHRYVPYRSEVTMAELMAYTDLSLPAGVNTLPPSSMAWDLGGEVAQRVLRMTLDAYTLFTLPPPVDGTIVWCQDCQVAVPTPPAVGLCTGGGTGALATAGSGAWTCTR